MSEFTDYLNAKPKTHPDYEGKPRKIDYPKGKVVARCGSVFLIKTSKHAYAAVYGLRTLRDMDYSAAAKEFGMSCLHQAECEGLI